VIEHLAVTNNKKNKVRKDEEAKLLPNFAAIA
jgi:hypothetical protein